MAAHVHAELIKAWADGAQVQNAQVGTENWVDCKNPIWVEEFQYRIKPAEPERVYPETKMTAEDMANAIHHRSADVAECTKLANFALRHACDNGQIVTREEFDKLHAEFDRAVGDRAKRDMAVAMAVRDKAQCYMDGIWLMDLEAIIASVK